MGIIVGEEGKDLESERKVCNRETTECNVSYDCNFGVVIKIETQ